MEYTNKHSLDDKYTWVYNQKMYIFCDNTEYSRFLSAEPDLKGLKRFIKFLKTKPPKGEHPPTLIITDQTLDEYYRAENQRVEDSRKLYSKEEFIVTIPNLSKKPSAAEKAIDDKGKLLKEAFEKVRKEKTEKFEKDITETKKLIAEIFSLATRIDCDDNIFQKAQKRDLRGMHPKRSVGSIGDLINWEILLSNPDDAEYYIVTQDKDFIESENTLHRTLKDEWSSVHSKGIKVFSYIGKLLDILAPAPTKPKKSSGSQEDSLSTTTIPSTTNTSGWGSSVYVSGTNASNQNNIHWVKAGTNTTGYGFGGGTIGNTRGLNVINEEPDGTLWATAYSYPMNEPRFCPHCGSPIDKLNKSNGSFMAFKQFNFNRTSADYYCYVCQKGFSVSDK